VGNAPLVVLIIIASALSGCATNRPSQSVDARATCEQLTKDSASSPELVDKNYFAQCMIAHSASAPAGQKPP
jgi:hypothetical protein